MSSTDWNEKAWVPVHIPPNRATKTKGVGAIWRPF
jgi:hypothetical protein